MKKLQLTAVLLSLAFLISGISASSVFAANTSGEKTNHKISEQKENRNLVQENADIEASSYLSADAVSDLKDNSTVTITKLDPDKVKLEITNATPYKTVTYEDGTVENSYSKTVLFAEPVYVKTPAPTTSSLSNSTGKLQVSYLSNKKGMTIKPLGTGSQEYTYGGFNVSLYVKLSYTHKIVNGNTVTRLDTVYGKLVSVSVNYYRNFAITAQNMGAWRDSTTSLGTAPLSGANYYYAPLNPSFGTLYSVSSSFGHFMQTGEKRGSIVGTVSVEYRHSSETAWSLDATRIKIGDV